MTDVSTELVRDKLLALIGSHASEADVARVLTDLLRSGGGVTLEFDDVRLCPGRATRSRRESAVHTVRPTLAWRLMRTDLVERNYLQFELLCRIDRRADAMPTRRVPTRRHGCP